VQALLGSNEAFLEEGMKCTEGTHGFRLFGESSLIRIKSTLQKKRMKEYYNGGSGPRRRVPRTATRLRATAVRESHGVSLALVYLLVPVVGFKPPYQRSISRIEGENQKRFEMMKIYSASKNNS